MKKLLIPAFLLCLVFYSCDSDKKRETTASDHDSVAGTVTKDEEPGMASPMPDSATMMKNWKAYMTPGESHKLLASWDGTWTGDISMWMAPGAPPEVSKGRAVNKMIYGGRYQHSKHYGNMMGMPFEGEATTGYDNIKKKYISSWIDNMGTGIMTLEGNWDDATKTLTLAGKCIDPAAGTGKEMTIRQIQKVIDDNTHYFEMYGPGPDGKEFKMMEIKMTRK